MPTRPVNTNKLDDCVHTCAVCRLHVSMQLEHLTIDKVVSGRCCVCLRKHLVEELDAVACCKEEDDLAIGCSSKAQLDCACTIRIPGKKEAAVARR